jgi:hypothetical protein
VVDLLPNIDSSLSPQAARAAGRGRLTCWRSWLAPFVSGALVGWLVWRVSPQALLEAATRLDLVVLVPATLGLVAALYLWDPGVLYLAAVLLPAGREFP